MSMKLSIGATLRHSLKICALVSHSAIVVKMEELFLYNYENGLSSKLTTLLAVPVHPS